MSDQQIDDVGPPVAPVVDWVTDWDHHHPAWNDDPYPIWDDLRGRCPMARTERYNAGVWLPLKAEQLDQITHDTDTFSNDHDGITVTGPRARLRLPPIHNDPPEHQELRRVLLPFFAPKRIAAWETAIENRCRSLADAIAERGRGDAAVDYSQHIPVHAMAAILGIDPSDGDLFRHWIVQFIEVGGRVPEIRMEAEASIVSYMAKEIAARRKTPGDDLISHLVQARIDGELLDDDTIERMLVLQLVAGIDTTWSSIGAALWHLATHPDDRRRLVDDPGLIPTAVEEFLRAYAPVNVTRRVANDTTLDGVAMHAGDTIMMTFPIACRDPERFERADEVVIDRERNRHVAFGIGIHRCLGSNLARLEMNVAVRCFLERMPNFSVDPSRPVTWSAGQIRGPRTLPILVDT